MFYFYIVSHMSHSQKSTRKTGTRVNHSIVTRDLQARLHCRHVTWQKLFKRDVSDGTMITRDYRRL